MHCFGCIGVLAAAFVIPLNLLLAVEPSDRFQHGLFPRSSSDPGAPRWQVISREMYGTGSASVQWIDNDKKIVCGDRICGDRVLDTKTWRTIDVLPPPDTSGVILTKRSGNGRWVATAGRDNRLHFTSSAGDLVATCVLMSPSRMEWSPDGKRLAAIDGYRRVKTWLHNGEADLDLGRMPSYVSSLAWSPDGAQLAVSSRDGTVRVWSLPPAHPGKRLKHPAELEKHPGQSGARALLAPVTIKTETKSPSVRWASKDALATYAVGGPIQFWTMEGKKKHAIQRQRLYRFQWSPDGETLAIQHNQQLELCDADGLAVKKWIDMPDDHGNFAWSKDGRRLAILSAKMNLFVWDVHEADRPVKVVSGRGSLSWISRRPVQWTPDGEQLTSGSRDAAIRVWNVDGSPAKSWKTPGQRTTVVSMQPSEELLASYTWPDRKTRFWKLDGTELATESESDAHMGMKWRPDGRQFAAPKQQNASIRFFDSSGRLVHTGRHGDSRRVDSLAWSPDGRWLATASDSESPPTIRLWRGDGSPPRILKGSTETVVAIAWHPDSQRITSISKKTGEVRHWNIDGKMGKPIASHGSGGGLQWSPDGQWLAAYSGGRVRIYDLDDQEIADLPNANTFIRHLVWCPDSRWLAIQAYNGIYVYDLKGKLVNKFFVLRPASESAAWSPDGAQLACATIFNTMILWDAKSARTEWVGLPLRNGKSATVTVRGEVLTDDRAAFDEEYVFMQEDPDGRVVFRDSREFEKTLPQKKPNREIDIMPECWSSRRTMPSALSRLRLWVGRSGSCQRSLRFGKFGNFHYPKIKTGWHARMGTRSRFARLH